MRKQYSAEFKAKVAIEAIKEMQTANEIASKFEIHPNLVSGWKKHFLKTSSIAFSSTKSLKNNQEQVDIDDLLKKIGKLEVENEFLKKSGL